MKYGSAGVRTVLVTATRGDRGKTGNPPVCAPDELAACRERELREAASLVGFDEVHILDYHDKALADAPPDAIRQSLVSLIRRIRPSVVASFDPNGFNLHPDHIAISRFTVDAVAAASDPSGIPRREIRTSFRAWYGRRRLRRGRRREWSIWTTRPARTSCST